MRYFGLNNEDKLELFDTCWPTVSTAEKNVFSIQSIGKMKDTLFGRNCSIYAHPRKATDDNFNCGKISNRIIMDCDRRASNNFTLPLLTDQMIQVNEQVFSSLYRVTEHCTHYGAVFYKPTTFSANPVSLAHLSNASAEAMKAVRDELESPDSTDVQNNVVEG